MIDLGYQKIFINLFMGEVHHGVWEEVKFNYLIGQTVVNLIMEVVINLKVELINHLLGRVAEYYYLLVEDFKGQMVGASLNYYEVEEKVELYYCLVIIINLLVLKFK